VSKTPPVPPDNRSPKGPGDPEARSPEARPPADEAVRDDRDRNLEQQGRQGNIRQNTRNQGYQQDR
jgi:hypothetical protein